MDEKLKILLGSEDVIVRSNEDLFININLKRSFFEYKKEKYDNDFDLAKQFQTERDASRNFRLYGLVESNVIDLDDYPVRVYSDSGLTQLVYSTFTTPLNFAGDVNVYNKKRGKYYIPLDNYTGSSVYVTIPSNYLNILTQSFEQQLVFHNLDGEFVSYGTETVEVDSNLNTIDINNNFPFFYNKHWIKKDLSILEEKPAIMSFSATPLSNTVAETQLFSPQTIYSKFSVVLNKPSPFGIEQAELFVNSSTLDPASEIIVTDSYFNILSIPATIGFSQGETFRDFYFLSPLDTLHETTENVIFGLRNLNHAVSGNPTNHSFFVTDATPAKLVTLNFQNIYQNRNYFTGIEFPNTTPVNTVSMNPMPAVLRNGLEFEGTPMEFYPAEEFKLSIRNRGINTIMPINPALGIYSETLFPSANTFSHFTIVPQYQNTDKHTIKFHFKEFTSTHPGVYSFKSGFTINSMPIVDYYKVCKIDYEHYRDCLKNTVSSNGVFYGGWNRYSNIRIPFDVFENPSDLTITIIAKSPGTRLDVGTYGFNVDLFNANDPGLQTLGITAETIQNFVYSPQIPLEIKLRANTTSDIIADYDFMIGAKGFKTLYFNPSNLPCSTAATTYYLATAYKNMLRNWDNTTDKPIYLHSGVTSGWRSNSSSGLYTPGDVYINGHVFLSYYSFNNTVSPTDTLNSNSSNSHVINTTQYGNAANDFEADFLASPIAVIPSTTEIFSTQSSKQIGYLGIRPVSSTSISDPSVNQNRLFDFRTGTTGPYNTYFFNNNTTSHAYYEWATGSHFFSYGGIVGTNHMTTSLPLVDYLQNGNTPESLTSQGLIGITYPTLPSSETTLIRNISNETLAFGVADFIKLSANTSVPFEFRNFIEMQYTSGPHALEFYSNNTMCYIETQPYEEIGVTINKANNKMGGYSLIRPITVTPPITSSVSFNVSTTFNNTHGSITTILVSLSSPSVSGNETVSVYSIPGTVNVAYNGIHYSDSSNPLPIGLSWAIGEQTKTLQFENTMPMFNNFTLSLALGITNLVNILPGSTMTSIILFSR